MKLTKTTATIAALCMLVSATGLAAKKKAFELYPVADHIDRAIATGTAAAGDSTALELKDTGQSWNAAFMAAGGEMVGTSTGFSLDVYTPFTWIAQQASWNAKKYLPFRSEDVADDMAAGVLRVYANPDRPKFVSAEGLVGTSGVEHVIIRSTKKKGFEVLQPAELFEDSIYVQNAFGGDASFASMLALFELDAVKRIAALDKKGEFFIVVIGTTGEEKKFKVKTKHFKRLP